MEEHDDSLETIKHFATELLAAADLYHQTDARALMMREYAKKALAEVEQLIEAGRQEGERVWPNPGVAAKKK